MIAYKSPTRRAACCCSSSGKALKIAADDQAIARVVVARPTYLFCDEPNSGLDPKTAIDNLIKEITQEYNTIINTHDMNSVLEIGQKIIYLKDGAKKWEGDYNTILSDENQAINDLVYSSDLMSKVKKAMRRARKRAAKTAAQAVQQTWSDRLNPHCIGHLSYQVL